MAQIVGVGEDRVCLVLGGGVGVMLSHGLLLLSARVAVCSCLHCVCTLVCSCLHLVCIVSALCLQSVKNEYRER